MDISNFPYRTNIPAVIVDNLVGWKDVKADGNCGFRCVDEVFHGGQENWLMARQAILNELKAEPNMYQKIYFDGYISALRRIDWDDGQCGEDHYMQIVSDLFPIANFYQCTLMCFIVTDDGLNPRLSATLLPWNVGAHITRPTKELTIAHLGRYKHYILLELKYDFPVPPIPSLWYDIIDKTVVDWDRLYVTRRQRWDCLTNRSRDSTHLDVSDVSKSTLKRRKNEHGITKWTSSRKRMNPDTNRNETHSTCTCRRNLSHLNSVDHSNPAGHGQGVEHLAGPSQPTLLYHLTSERNVVNDSNLDAVTRTVGEPPLSTQYCMDSHQHVEEHSNGATQPASVNTDLAPNERSSTFVVKATYNEDTARFNFSLTFSIEKLKEEVSKSLDLEVGTFKIRYLDDEKEWMLMNRISDLELALNLSRASGSNVVRLLIMSKT